MRPLFNASKPSRLVVVALLVLLGSLLGLAAQDPPDASAYASSVAIECSDDHTSEGDDFRLHVTNEGSSYFGTTTIKVYWTTDAGTADESDYEPLHREGQASNRSQSRNGRMGRTFHTRRIPTANSRNNSSSVPSTLPPAGPAAAPAAIDINDDDGPGAVRTWIDSRPTGGTYERDDTIRIRQQFTEKRHGRRRLRQRGPADRPGLGRFPPVRRLHQRLRNRHAHLRVPYCRQ